MMTGKKIFRFNLLLITILIVFSCKKENSCEGCKENNKPPIAIAGPDQVITLPTDSVSFDGRSCSDPDATISHWLWKKILGSASFNIPSAATYILILQFKKGNV
jgi:K319L-like, PKD domain